MSFDIIRAERLKTKEQWAELREQFRKDRTPTSEPTYPTHILRRKNEVVGSFCVNSPTVYLQMDKEKCSARDSQIMWGILESILAEYGIRSYILPCEKTSPFFPMADKRLDRIVGEQGCLDHHLFKKKIR